MHIVIQFLVTHIAHIFFPFVYVPALLAISNLQQSALELACANNKALANLEQWNGNFAQKLGLIRVLIENRDLEHIVNIFDGAKNRQMS